MARYRVIVEHSSIPFNVSFPKGIDRTFEGSLMLKPNTYSAIVSESEKDCIVAFVKKAAPRAALRVLTVTEHVLAEKEKPKKAVKKQKNETQSEEQS